MGLGDVANERKPDARSPRAGRVGRLSPVEALEDAFENNSPEVHSYLQLETGEVLRIVDGVADPSMHARVIADPIYLRIDPVSSREQYRWMERFIATVDDLDLRHNLLAAIDGKGAFRRFKDVLAEDRDLLEAWYAFRIGRVHEQIHAWLALHGLAAATPPPAKADEVKRLQTELGAHVAMAGDGINTQYRREDTTNPDYKHNRVAPLRLRGKFLQRIDECRFNQYRVE